VSTTNVRVYTHIVTNEPIDSLHLVIDFPKEVQLAFKHPSTIIFSVQHAHHLWISFPGERLYDWICALL